MSLISDERVEELLEKERQFNRSMETISKCRNQECEMDIVERLRAWYRPGDTITGDVQLYLDAADEIERLRDELANVQSEWDIASKAESRCHKLKTEIGRLRAALIAIRDCRGSSYGTTAQDIANDALAALVSSEEDDAAQGMDSGRNTGGKSYR